MPENSNLQWNYYRGGLQLYRVRNCLSTACRAYKFPEAASFNIALSRLKSATNRFSRMFSFSNSLNRFACSKRNPPYSLRQRINVCSAVPITLAISPRLFPLASRTYASRNFTIICSVEYRFLAITSPLPNGFYEFNIWTTLRGSGQSGARSYSASLRIRRD